MSKTSGDSKRGVVVGFGALAIVIVSAAAYYGGMAGSENAAGTVMQAKRYKADSTTGPTPTPTTADTQQAGQPTGGGHSTGAALRNSATSGNSATSNNSAMPSQGAVVVSNQADTGSAMRNQSTTGNAAANQAANGNAAANQAAAKNAAANAAGGNVPK